MKKLNEADLPPMPVATRGADRIRFGVSPSRAVSVRAFDEEKEEFEAGKRKLLRKILINFKIVL